MFKSKINMKLYPIYKMFSWDLLFYYAISFLFLTQEKGCTASQVILLDSFYLFSKLPMQFICIPISDKLGYRNCLILGNLLVLISIYVIIISASISHIFIAFFIMGFGYSAKDLCESPLLYSSIPTCEKKRNIFAKIDAKGCSLWYLADAITSIIASFLFVVNPYLPMYLCITALVISIMICFNFEEDTYNDSNVDFSERFS